MKKYSYLILALCPPAVFGQAPVVGAGGIVNHFSYAPSTAPNGSPVSFTSPMVTFSPSGLDANGGTFILIVGAARTVTYQ
ncbi:MAG: hypothetical protein ACRD44_10665 [Bryobacteraceae bacterium]